MEKREKKKKKKESVQDSSFIFSSVIFISFFFCKLFQRYFSGFRNKRGSWTAPHSPHIHFHTSHQQGGGMGRSAQLDCSTPILSLPFHGRNSNSSTLITFDGMEGRGCCNTSEPNHFARPGGGLPPRLCDWFVRLELWFWD